MRLLLFRTFEGWRNYIEYWKLHDRIIKKKIKVVSLASKILKMAKTGMKRNIFVPMQY